MSIAEVAAKRSNCISRQVGAVIVKNEKNGRRNEYTYRN